jgi:NADPH:quinone reductase-like Zn-dependent oxidoreductase
MLAVGIVEFGGPEVLRLVELPDPEAGPGEIRLRVHAATVNPTDTVLRSGGRADRLKDIPPPHVPGMDAAGVVEQIGEGVDTDLRVGERVMAVVVPLGQHGAYAERVVVPAASVARSPSIANDAQAATIPMNGLTVRQALDELALEPGQTLAVTGAAGAVGGYAVQMGKAMGLRVIADAAPRDERLVLTLGADVIVARGDGFARRMRRIAGDGVDGLIDGAVMDAVVVPAVRDGGRMATLRGYDGGDVERRGITFCPIFVRNYARKHDKLDDLRDLAEQGELTLRVARTLPAAEAPEAHRLLEAGGVRGRLVLEF